MVLDNVDLKILDELQRDGALSNVTLAKRIGLSPSPCLARVKAFASQAVHSADRRAHPLPGEPAARRWIGQWPEAAMVMFLFALAEMIEAKSLDRARNAIRGLMDLAPETATVRQPDGSWVEQEVKSIELGAVVRVKPGERIGLDGEVTSGQSSASARRARRLGRSAAGE